MQRNDLREKWEVNKYLWMCLLFIALYLPLSERQGVLGVSLSVAYLLFGLAVVNGALRTWCGYRTGGNSRLAGGAFTLSDIALISLAVRFTGGLQSELWLAYFVLLVSEALFATTLETVLLTAAMTLGYLAATYSLPHSDAFPLTFATRIFFLFIVGAFGRRLSGERERRNREVALLSEQVVASEERARIAREVHDSLGHALVACILRLELCSRLVQRSAEKHPDPQVAEVAHMLREEVPALRNAWNEGRDFAFHLRPWDAADTDFAASIRRHITRFAERTGIVVTVTLMGNLDDLTPETRLTLTRLLQEALTNIARHAQASQTQIRVERADRELIAEIQDNGVGFDAQEKTGSFGLNAMRERTAKQGGQFRCDTQPGHGTTLHIRLPL